MTTNRVIGTPKGPKQKAVSSSKLPKKRENKKSGRKKRPYVITPTDVDFECAALYNAVLSAMDRSPDFSTGRSLSKPELNPLLYVQPARERAKFAHNYVLSKFWEKFFFSDELDPTPLEEAATKKFLACIDDGKNLDFKALRESDSEVNELLARMAFIIDGVLGDFDLLRMYKHAKHGPNSTTSIPFQDSYPDVKIDDLSGTGPALANFFQLLCYDFQLAKELGITIDSDSILESWGQFSDLCKVKGASRTDFVPKSFKSLRTKSSEHTVNMLQQLMTGRYITHLLRLNINIDLSSQPDVHKNLARLASLYPEMGLMTLDWSEASDRIWLLLCKEVISEFWFRWLCSIRCTHTELPDGSVVELPMIGTMGNGFTFPLQTLLFYAFLTACSEMSGTHSFVSVFGDDGISCSSSRPTIERLASKIGWRLNVGKTFSEGPFRESCGGDYYRGLDVSAFNLRRPERLKSKNALRSWSYIAANGCIDMLNRLGLPTGDAIAWLLSFHRQYKLGKVFIVPPSFPDCSGLRVKECSIANKTTWVHPTYVSDDFVMPCFHLPDQVWSFKALVNAPPNRKVRTEFPWYHAFLLRDSGNPEKYKVSVFGFCFDDLESLPTQKVDFQWWKMGRPSLDNGDVPTKRLVLQSRTQFTYEWM